VSVTVLIATRGRAAGLRRTLESLLSPTNLQTRNWEALVITDFDCQDGSVEVCEEFAARFPNCFRFLVQQTTGKSNALNLGIAVAKGDVLALTDDDVLVAPNYVQSVHSIFEQYSVDGVQGRVVLDCEGDLPKWMSRRQALFMSHSDYGNEVLEWNHHTLFGTNMAVRTQAARSVGGFSPELGAGTALGFGEDTEFSLRLRGAGCRFIYAPQIVVTHVLPRNRLTRSFFRERYFKWARATAYYEPRPKVPLWRFGLYSVKRAFFEEVEALWHRCANCPAEALDCQCHAREYIGVFWQHYRFYRGEPRQLSKVTVWPEKVI
jgi:glucosyl-dolichyl phosphate glucuronosyltransferase